MICKEVKAERENLISFFLEEKIRFVDDIKNYNDGKIFHIPHSLIVWKVKLSILETCLAKFSNYLYIIDSDRKISFFWKACKIIY